MSVLLAVRDGAGTLRAALNLGLAACQAPRVGFVEGTDLLCVA